MFTGLIFIVFGLLGLALYFLPTVIAQQRSHRSLGGIFVLNLLLGWSLLGWIGALIWALSSPQPVIVVQTGPTYIPQQGYGQPYGQPPVYPQHPNAPAVPTYPVAYTAQPAAVLTPVSGQVLPVQQNPPL